LIAPSRTNIRVRYAETDQMGIVYYANYFIWFEVGRTDLLRAEGWSYRGMEQEGFALPVIEAHCSYREPAKYDDDLEIKTRGTLLTPVRVRFVDEIPLNAMLKTDRRMLRGLLADEPSAGPPMGRGDG